MDLRGLRYFVEVVRQNSFTRAAETLHVTQPSISKMVRTLEEELGGPLLLREGRGVQLTDAGEVVYARGQEVIAQSQRLRQEVAEIDGMARGTLTVGVAPTLGHYIAPVISRFQQLYPGVELKVDESGARGQRQRVFDGDVDMSLGLLDPEDTPHNSYTIARQKTRAVLAASEVADHEAPIRWSELRDRSFVLYASDFALHQAVLEHCAAAGYTPHIQLESRYWDFIGDLVANGVGVAVMLEHVAARYDPQRVRSRPLVEPELAWDLGLFWRPGYISRAARAWLDCVRVIYAEQAPHLADSAYQHT